MSSERKGCQRCWQGINRPTERDEESLRETRAHSQLKWEKTHLWALYQASPWRAEVLHTQFRWSGWATLDPGSRVLRCSPVVRCRFSESSLVGLETRVERCIEDTASHSLRWWHCICSRSFGGRSFQIDSGYRAVHWTSWTTSYFGMGYRAPFSLQQEQHIVEGFRDWILRHSFSGQLASEQTQCAWGALGARSHVRVQH